MGIRTKTISLAIFTLMTAVSSFGQSVTPTSGERIFVRGGRPEEAFENKAGVRINAMTPDSLFRFMAGIDSLRADGIIFDRAEIDSLITAMIDRTSPTGDTLTESEMEKLVAERRKLPLNAATVKLLLDDRRFQSRYLSNGVDTLIRKLTPLDTVGLSRREKRRLARMEDTTTRYSPFFRDTMKLSPMIGISLAVPGFAQLHNKQYWKIPVIWAGIGAGIGIGIWQHNNAKPYKQLYNYHLMRPPAEGTPAWDRYQAVMEEIQGNMIKYNTYKQLAFSFAAVSYIYGLVDGTLNYPSQVNQIKKATTLSLLCPGAGQIYNKQFWKVPIVIGGMAALVYCIDFNNRGYVRFSRAYNALTDDDPATVDEFKGAYSADFMKNLKNNYRRNRDLCIILTGLFYVVQVIDAHASAHMKTYDISDDLSMNLEPQMDRFYSMRAGGNVNTFGVSLNFRF